KELTTMKLLPSMDWLAAASSFLLAVVLTPAVRRLACALGMMARPKSDRWHKQPTALLGGLAVFASVMIVALTTVPHSLRNLIVIGASAVLFLVGLLDDFVQLKPYQKLVGQIVGAAMVVASGLTLHWTAFTPLDVVITILWLIGITNAINLL